MKLPQLLAPVLAVAVACAGLLPAQQSSEKLDLSVLYAGDVDHARTATWLEFLGRHVQRAEPIELIDLSSDTAADFDVVIVDSPSPFGEEGRFEMPQTPELTREFGKPTVLLGAAGGALLRSVKIKLDWL